MSKLTPVKPKRSKLNEVHMGYFKKRGDATPPVVRTAATGERALSPAERLEEKLEERRLRKAWDENRLPSSLKGS